MYISVFLLSKILLRMLTWLCGCLMILTKDVEVNPEPKNNFQLMFFNLPMKPQQHIFPWLLRNSRFFYIQRYFSTQSQCCLNLSKLSIKCCSGVAYYIYYCPLTHFVFSISISISRPGLFVLYFYNHFHHYQPSLSIIKTDKFVFAQFLV